MRWAGHVELMGEMKDANTPEWKRIFGRARRICKNIIKIILDN
jgi:hypothetical protein